MAGGANVSHENGDLSPVPQLFAERFRQVHTILVVVRIADVGKPLAALSGVGAGKGHDLRPGIHHLIKQRRNDLLVRHVHADHVVVLLLGHEKPLCLVLGGSAVRRHILVCNDDPPVQILSLGLLHAKGDGVPPGVNSLICEIKIIVILQRRIRIQFTVEIHRTAHRIIRSGSGGRTGILSSPWGSIVTQDRRGRGQRTGRHCGYRNHHQ